jgi:drug/metabolite transporter (DMT)-like permease
MAGKDELLTIAEIAVALIGFSGLIFVFRARDVSELETRDLSALAMIVGAGSVALAFALLPLPLWYLDLAEPLFWRISSGLFGATMLAGSSVFYVVNRRLRKSGHPERTPGLNRVTLLCALLTGALLVLSASGALPPGPAIYLLGLVVCLLLCLAFVGFILVVARRSSIR